MNYLLLQGSVYTIRKLNAQSIYIYIYIYIYIFFFFFFFFFFCYVGCHRRPDNLKMILEKYENVWVNFLQTALWLFQQRILSKTPTMVTLKAGQIKGLVIWFMFIILS